MNKKLLTISLLTLSSLALIVSAFLYTPVQVKAEVAEFEGDTFLTSFVSSTNTDMYSYSDQVIDIDSGFKNNQFVWNKTLVDSNNVSHMCISNLSPYSFNNHLRVSGSMIDTFTLSFPYIFEKYLTFYKPVDYYPYNIWDEEWEVGNINYYTGENVEYSSSIRSINYIPVIPNTSYYIYSSRTIYFRWYDSNMTYLPITTPEYASNSTFVSPNNAYYLRIIDDTTSYNHDISIYLASKSANYYISHNNFYNQPLERDTYQIPNYDYWPRSNTSQSPKSLEFDLYYYFSTDPLTYSSLDYETATSYFVSSYDLKPTLNNNYDCINLDFSNISKASNYNYYIYFFIFPKSELTEGYFYYCYENAGVLDDIILDYYAINNWWNEDYDGMSLSHGFTPRVYNNLGFDKTNEYNVGYTNGYDVGLSTGFNNGQSTGYATGYSTGYSVGFQDGEQMNVGDPSITGLLFSIFQVPITILSSLFSFTIFGTEVWYLFVSLLILGLVIWLLRKILFK